MNFSWLRKIISLPASERLLTRAFSEQRNFHRLRRLENRSWNGMSHNLTPQLTPGTNFIQVRNAGHNKWSNIKNIKMAKDLQKARESSKVCQMMRVAIKEKGSTDPKLNKALADAIERGREARIPNATLMKVLESIKNAKDLKVTSLYIKGPGKSIFILEVMTDHLPRCRSEIGSAVRKYKATWTDEKVLYQFEHKGIILCNSFEGKPITEDLLDTAVVHAIEVDAEEVFFQNHLVHGNIFEFVTEPASFHKAKHALMKLNYVPVDSDLYYVAINPVVLTEEELQVATDLSDRFLTHTEVVKLTDNIA